MLDFWSSSVRSFCLVVAVLTPRLACLIVQGGWSVLNSVPITERTNQHMLFDTAEPKQIFLSAWKREYGKESRARRGPSSIFNPRKHVYEAALIIKWLRASASLKALGLAPEAAEAFADIFGYCGPVSDETLMASLRISSTELLRRARVRLDVVAMNLLRDHIHYHSTGVGALMCWTLYVDSSPQPRGIEFYAVSLDEFGTRTHCRRLLPAVILNKGMLTANGKQWRFFGFCGW